MSQLQGYAAYGSAIAVTPSDTTLLTCKALYVGGAGNVSVQTRDGATTVTFTAPPVGTVLPINIENGHVLATGTTATLLIALS